uniref:Capon-like protein n=1 Tax=Haemonchus contortus TaxID=6289 RepID=A0A7I5EE71_HAECO
MIRFDPDEDEDMSEEKRFYYLRLMAKPGRKPIKTKFVTWSPEQQSSSRDDDPVLESQAMRVVRTIGQAFEVCHKVAQEQMLEKHEDEAAKSKASLASEDDTGIPLDVIEERGAAEESSRSQSPAEPSTGGPLYGRRMSLFQPRKASSASSSVGTAIDTTVQGGVDQTVKPETSTSVNPNNPLLQQLTSQQSAQQQQSSQQQQLQQQQQQRSSHQQLAQAQPTKAMTATAMPPSQQSTGIPIPVKFVPSSTPFPAETYPGFSLPSVSESAPQYQQEQQQVQKDISAFTSSSTLPHARTWSAGPIGAIPPFPAVPPSNSLEGHSLYYPVQQLVSSSAQMPYGLSSPVLVSPYATLHLNIPSVDVNNPESAASLTRSLDQYNQQLIRSQLDQAQQSAQVAGCQVQLLRDQLTSETTARIEAQSRTHQLLNANRELLEQVQCLVQRLQQLETKITNEIQQSVQSPIGGGPQTSSAPVSCLPANPSFHEQDDVRLPAGTQHRQENQPYQVMTLADLRAGSLPPKVSRERRFKDDGAKTEPESNNEDTTDYSSSDQYEKSSTAIKANVPAHFNVLMTNPLADVSIPSSIGEREREQQDRDDDGEAQPGTSTSPQQRKPRSGGILRGEMEFARMSFNTRVSAEGLRAQMKHYQPPLYSKDVEERIEEEDGGEGAPVKKKIDDDRKDDRRKREKVTVESLFKADPPKKSAVSPYRTELAPTVFSNAIPPAGEPASSSLVTAMYPTIRRPVVSMVNRPKLDVVRKTTLRALSVDIGDEAEEENKNRTTAMQAKRRAAEVKNIDDLLNRNVDQANPGDSASLLAHLTRQDDGKLPNMPNGYP